MKTDHANEFARASAGCLGLVLLLFALMMYCGCATCEPEVIKVPVEVPKPYPVTVIPQLPPPPQCDQPEACPPTPPEVAQCSARNVTRLETCLDLWNRWWIDVNDVIGGLQQ